MTSYLPIANGRSIETECTGPSSSCRPFSEAGEPIEKEPVGSTTISGQSGQSRKVSPGWACFDVATRSTKATATPKEKIELFLTILLTSSVWP